jgi:carboxylesterase
VPPVTDEYPVIAGAEPWSCPGSGARASTALLLIHGFTGNPTSMRPLGQALGERGFRVEVIRLPGHGTNVRDMQRTRYADWRDAVSRALDGLLGQSKKVVLVGLSMGGSLALDLGATRAKDVAGLVAINAAVLDRPGLLAKLAPFVSMIVPIVPAQAAGLAKDDIAKPGQTERAYDRVPTKAGNSFTSELPRIRGALGSLRLPVLVAYSAQDHSVDPENSKAILRAVKGARALVLERSYHVATLDHDQPLLVERITEFADELAQPQTPPG